MRAKREHWCGLGVILAGLAVIGAPLGALGASYTWDQSGDAPLNDGAGNWNPTGGSNWYDGTNYTAWGNTAADEAVFGAGNGAAGTVTVGTVTVNRITFNAPGSETYTLSGGAITLAGTTPTLAADTNGTIASVLAGTNGLTKTGTGMQTLSGPVLYSGTTTVIAGELASANWGAAGLGAITVGNAAAGATLGVAGGTLSLGANNFFVGVSGLTAGNTATVNQSGGTVSFTGGNALLVGNGQVGTAIYNLSGGTLSTTFANGNRGVMIGVNSGAADNRFNLSGTGILSLASAGLQVGRSDSASSSTSNRFSQTGGTANVGILSIGGRAGTSDKVTSTFSVTGGSFSAGSFTYLANGTNDSVTILLGQAAQVTLPAFGSTGGRHATATANITFDFTTGSLASFAASATYIPAGAFNNAYLTANGAKFNVATGKDVTIGQVLSDHAGEHGVLSQSGTGALTLSGNNSYSGGLTVQGTGAVNLQHNNAAGTGTIYLQSGATGPSTTLGILGGITVTNPIVMDSTTGREGISSAAGNNTLSGGVTITGSGGSHLMFQSNTAGSTFTVSGNISGATYAGSVSLRGATGATGILNGVVNINSALQNNGNANWTLNTAGSDWTITQIFSAGNLILGVNDALDPGARVEGGGSGAVKLNGFNQTVAGLNSNTAGVRNGSGSSASRLTISGMGGDYTFGGVIADGGSQPLALVMNSAGRTQTLSATNTYGGSTTVDAGTLALQQPCLSARSPVFLNSASGGKLKLDFAGTNRVAGLYTNNVPLPPGEYGAAELPDFIDGNSNPNGRLLNSPPLYWTGATDTLWQTAGNWSASPDGSVPGETPTPASDVVLNADNPPANAIGALGGAAWANTLTFNAGNQSSYAVNDAGKTLTLTLGRIAVSNTVTADLHCTLGGTNGLIKAGGGTLTLSGASSYSGATAVNGGALVIGTVAASGTYNIASGAMLDFNPSSSINSGGYTFNGAGTLRIEKGLVFGGSGWTNVTVALSTGGLIRITGNAQVTGSSYNKGFWDSNLGSLQVDAGSTLNLVEAGTNGIAQFDALNGGGTVTIGYGTAKTLIVGAANGSGSFAGVLADGAAAMALTKNGTGTQTLSGPNTFSGNVTVSAGALRIASSQALGAGAKTVSLTNGTNGRCRLLLDGSGGDLSLAGPIGFQTSNGLDPTIENLAGNNTINGAITLTAGGGNTRVCATGGTLTLAGAIAPNTGGRTLALEGGSDGAISGVISDGGANVLAVSKTGEGSWTLSGANTYSGSTTVNAGTLVLQQPSLSARAPVYLNSAAGGKLKLDFAGTNIVGVLYTNNVPLPAGLYGKDELPGFIDSGSNPGGKLLSAGSLYWTGATGALWQTAGNWSASPDGSLPGVTPPPLADVFFNADNPPAHAIGVLGGAAWANTLTFNAGNQTSYTVNDTGSALTLALGQIAVSNTAAADLNCRLGGANGLTKAGGGTLTLSGANTYGGGTTVNAGTLQVNNAGAIPAATALAVNGGTFDLAGNSVTVASLAAGTASGAIVDTGAGVGTDVLRISGGNNAFLGVINDGASRKVAVTASNGNGTAFPSNVSNTYSGGLTLTGNERIYPVNGTTVTGGVVTKGPYGTGTITIGAYAGDNAQIFCGNGNSGSIYNNIVVNSLAGTDIGGNFRIDIVNNYVYGGVIANLSDIKIQSYSTSGTMTLSGAISGASGLQMYGNGGNVPTVYLANTGPTANSYQGTTTIGAGSLILSAADQIPNGAGKGNVSVAGTLNLNGFSETINGLSGAGLVTNAVATPVTLTLGDGNATATFSGAIGNAAGGDLSLTKIGMGTQTLSGTNTYSGATIVSSGTLAVSGSLGASAVTVTPGAKLAGTGSLAGTVTLSAGSAAIDLRDGVVGTLTLSNAGTALTLNGGSVLQFEIGATSDRINLTAGSLSASPTVTINVNAIAGAAPGVYVLLTNNAAIPAGNFVLGTTAGCSGTLGFSGDNRAILFTVSNVVFAPWWKGDVDGLWTAGNWDTTQGGGVDAGGVPGSASDVHFSADSAGNPGTTLGADFTIRSLIFDTGTGVTIGGANTLTVVAGITNLAAAGSNVISVGSLVLGADQTWDNSSANALVVSAPVNGSDRVLTKTGTGTLTFGGPGSILKALALNAGTLMLAQDLVLNNAGQVCLSGQGGTINSTGGRIVLGSGVAGNWQDWSSTAGSAITISAVIADDSISRGIDFFNSGTLILKGANTYTGGARLSATVAQVGVDCVGSVNSISSGPFGTGPMLIGANAACSVSADSATPRTILNAMNFNNNLTLGDATRNGRLTFVANADLGAAVRTVTVNSDAEFSGVLSNSGGIAKAGGRTLVLSGANTYTGETIMNGGILKVATLADYGVACAIGARALTDENTSVTGIGLHFTGGTLQYTGATAQSLNRQMRVLNGANAATIDASGSTPAATLSFTYSGANINFWDTQGTRTLTLTGSNTGGNTFALNVQSHTSGQTSLVKTGLGAWDVTNTHNSDAVTGSNSTYGGYGGGTTLAGGTLGFATNALGGGVIAFTGNATLRWDAGNAQDVSSGAGAGVARSLKIEAGVTATFNTGGNDVTLDVAIEVGGQGAALTKTGAGTMTLGGANTYSGPTKVQGGALNIRVPYLCATNDVWISTGATMGLNYTGTNDIRRLYLGGTLMPAGVYGSADTSALTGTGFLRTSDGARVPRGIILIVR